jgi:hypothetical protein
MKFFGLFVFWFTLFSAQAQESTEVGVSMPEIAMLDLEPTGAEVLLEIKSPNGAGTFTKNANSIQSKWINYTSAVRKGQVRDIFVQIEYGSVPPGMSMFVEASSVLGGAGQIGKTAGKMLLSYSPQRLVQGIGGAYTGNGAKNGHPLSYFLEINKVAELDYNASNKVGIVFTFIDL